MYLTEEVPEGHQAQGEALLVEECVTTWLCPWINCVCPLLSNTTSHLRFPWQVLYEQMHICPHATNWTTDKPRGVRSQWRHPSLGLGHPELSPRALFQTVPMELPKLLQQKMQLYTHFSGDLTAARSWQEGETSCVQLQLPTGPVHPVPPQSWNDHFFSELALTTISATVWEKNTLYLCKPLSLHSIFCIPVETIHIHTIIADSDDVFWWCGYLPQDEGVY